MNRLCHPQAISIAPRPAQLLEKAWYQFPVVNQDVAMVPVFNRVAELYRTFSEIPMLTTVWVWRAASRIAATSSPSTYRDS